MQPEPAYLGRGRAGYLPLVLFSLLDFWQKNVARRLTREPVLARNSPRACGVRPNAGAFFGLKNSFLLYVPACRALPRAYASF